MGSLLLILLFTAVIAAFLIVKKRENPPESNIPAPITPRTDLLFGYYGSYPAMDGNPSQFEETKDHINLFIASRWYGPEPQLAQIIEATNAGTPVMLDMAEPYQIGYNVNEPFDIAAAEIRVRTRFQQLADAGVLKNIVAIYPVDEPELFGWTELQVVDTNNMIRRVLAEFGQTAKLAIFYTNAFTWRGVGSFDWVGFDDYGSGTKIFTNGDYNKLKKVLRPDQRIMLIPGGCDIWRADPTQWYNKANEDQQVIALIPFVWRDNVDPKNDANAGIRSNGMAPAYRAIGMRIKTGT